MDDMMKNVGIIIADLAILSSMALVVL